ncbi:MAG TPA: aminopeptidase P family protein [Methylocystis sp.]|nr:aminopeptidase P family protein [Methylocystis sp.]
MFEAKFQSFADSGRPDESRPRLAALRAKLAALGLDGFLVPRADAHQNEYVAKCAERLAWLTGFTGSAGVCVVLADKAAVFVDGRYLLGAPREVDDSLFEIHDIAVTPPARFIVDHLGSGARIGYDPWVQTPSQIERTSKALEGRGAALVPVEPNPIDAIWTDRPPPPRAAISLYSERYAGADAESKIARIREKFGGADALLLSDPHAIAWVFNIRGADVAHTPIALAFALLPREGLATLYVDDGRLDAEARAALWEALRVAPPAQLETDLRRGGEAGLTVIFDRATAPAKLVETLRAAGGKPRLEQDPVALPKAIKNETELAGVRAAHLRDGAALTRFLAWFAREAPKGALTEIDAAEAVESFRRDTGLLRDISFPTIAAFGPHAAIPHYRVTESSNLKIGSGVFLLDSGAQYLDGTTDVTRTVAVGPAPPQLRDCFTRVLKGHIAIARAVFPKGACGAQLDAFARRSLWEAGLDFDHGVGHGVGAYLSVHEGPQRISKTGETPLEPGMILSDEPGYYRAGEYGIRLENLIVVEPRAIAGAEREMRGFETLTLAPFDLDCVEPALLAPEEIAWLDAYHARVRGALSPILDAETRAWLERATRNVSG